MKLPIPSNRVFVKPSSSVYRAIRKYTREPLTRAPRRTKWWAKKARAYVGPVAFTDEMYTQLIAVATAERCSKASVIRRMWALGYAAYERELAARARAVVEKEL